METYWHKRYKREYWICTVAHERNLKLKLEVRTTCSLFVTRNVARLDWKQILNKFKLNIHAVEPRIQFFFIHLSKRIGSWIDFDFITLIWKFTSKPVKLPTKNNSSHARDSAFLIRIRLLFSVTKTWTSFPHVVTLIAIFLLVLFGILIFCIFCRFP